MPGFVVLITFISLAKNISKEAQMNNLHKKHFDEDSKGTKRSKQTMVRMVRHVDK